MFFAYILKSEKDNSFYYGSTKDLIKKLKYHNSGRVRYTKGLIPYRLHYFESFQLRSEAMLREKFFKTIDGYNWLKAQGII